jgi:anti-anti-sigma factor
MTVLRPALHATLRLIPAEATAPADNFSMTFTDVHPGISLVRVLLAGELDLRSGPLLLSGLERLCGPGRAPLGGLVVLDLSELTFIDSTGLTALSESRARLGDQGWRICVTHPDARARKLIDIGVAAGWGAAGLLCENAAD